MNEWNIASIVVDYVRISFEFRLGNSKIVVLRKENWNDSLKSKLKDTKKGFVCREKQRNREKRRRKISNSERKVKERTTEKKWSIKTKCERTRAWTDKKTNFQIQITRIDWLCRSLKGKIIISEHDSGIGQKWNNTRYYYVHRADDLIQHL